MLTPKLVSVMMALCCFYGPGLRHMLTLGALALPRPGGLEVEGGVRWVFVHREIPMLLENRERGVCKFTNNRCPLSRSQDNPCWACYSSQYSKHDYDRFFLLACFSLLSPLCLVYYTNPRRNLASLCCILETLRDLLILLKYMLIILRLF